MRFLLPALLLVGAAPLALPTAAAEPVEVAVDLHVINFGDYAADEGTYVLDFYLIFRWDPVATPTGFTPESFEFMNGRATSKDMLFDGFGADGRHELWYRVQASLRHQPRFDNYPYDHQELILELEDSVRTTDALVYVPELAGSGLDEEVRVAGWDIRSTNATVALKEYPFGESYSRFIYTIEVARPPLSMTLRSFLAPVAFMGVTAVGFLLGKHQTTNRLTLSTGMLISAVGFHVSQTIGLPSLSTLTLFDRFMVATYVFIACSIGVTALIAYNEEHWKRPERTPLINRRGAVATVALPVLVFLLSQLL